MRFHIAKHNAEFIILKMNINSTDFNYFQLLQITVEHGKLKLPHLSISIKKTKNV